MTTLRLMLLLPAALLAFGADQSSIAQTSNPAPSAAHDSEANSTKPEGFKPRVMPTPSATEMVPMRDGVRLATYVYLPPGPGPFPTILIRTVYRNGIVNWGNSRPATYQAAGYAMVWQTTRGIDKSEGHYHFLADDRNDGYDTVEWIAKQPWSDGNVGMDHASYLGSTQLEAAATKPPHLKAIVPHVPAVDLFHEIPYNGGIFIRAHALDWGRLISVKTIAELNQGIQESLDNPEWLRHLTMRPLTTAADGVLAGDQLAEYKAYLQHPTRDAYWLQREYTAKDYAKMDLGVLFVGGNFDPGVGILTAWRGLEANAPHPEKRHLLIGPWTHVETYSATEVIGFQKNGPRESTNQGVTHHPPYEFGNAALMDMFALRIAFFDRYLKGKAPSVPALPNRVKVFVTGSNEWREFKTYPVPQRRDTKLFLTSQGNANSVSGDGSMSFEASSGAPDHVVSDPFNPVIDAWGGPKAAKANESKEVLVYTSTPLKTDLTIIGEPQARLQVSADTPDADLIVNISEVYPDGKAVRLGMGGALRLRYREGFDKEVLLKPGQNYAVTIPLTYIGHTLKAGHRVRIEMSGTSFPGFDPNPNTGEPIGTAVKMQRANLTISHDSKQPSFILLPVVPASDAH